MKTLIKWVVKRYANKAAIKEAIHAANATLAQKEASERTAKITDIGNDVAELTGVYLNAYANDGKIDDAELAAIDAKCDATVDKYVSDATIDALIDKLIG